MSAVKPTSSLTSKLFDLSGRKALVTGASSGLGRHFAVTLAKAGAAVAVAARRSDRLAELVHEIEDAGGKAFAVGMDVTSRASVVRALAEIEAGFGVADIIVNNAGVTNHKRFLDYTEEDWNLIINTNLTGAWNVAQETVRRLVATGKPGSLINITSIFSTRVMAGTGPYIATKAGLKHLTQSLALELARHGIRVNAIAPGFIPTELNHDQLFSEGGEKMKSRIPMRRFGDTSDLDGPLLLLASDASAYMTGAEIVVDGGHVCNTL